MTGPERPTKHTTLAEYPYVVVRFRCHACRRGGERRLAILARNHGPGMPVGELLRMFMSNCPWDPYDLTRRPQKYGHRCGAFLPDLNSGRPPDLPPSMTGLTLIEGGKPDMLPAEPRRDERRRRVGGEDE